MQHSRQALIGTLRSLANRLENAATEPGLLSEDLDHFIPVAPLSFLLEIDEKLDRLLERREPSRCRLADTSDETVVEFITGIGATARARALNHLGGCLQGARHLTICDPYLLLAPRRGPSARDYVASIEAVLPPTLAEIEIFRAEKQRQQDVASEMNDMFKRRGIRARTYVTNDIHDRVWIANHDRAYAVGTSFNGLGNKCAFILPIPKDDLRSFLDEIQQRRANKRSKSV